MRYLIISLLSVLLLYSCKKETFKHCDEDPLLVLVPHNYTYEEWDTVVIQLFEPGTNNLFTADTFYPSDLHEYLAVYVDEQTIYDVDITLPQAGTTHTLRNITLTTYSLDVTNKQVPQDCYKHMSYIVDGVYYETANEARPRAVLKN